MWSFFSPSSDPRGEPIEEKKIIILIRSCSVGMSACLSHHKTGSVYLSDLTQLDRPATPARDTIRAYINVSTTATTTTTTTTTTTPATTTIPLGVVTARADLLFIIIMPYTARPGAAQRRTVRRQPSFYQKRVVARRRVPVHGNAGFR